MTILLSFRTTYRSTKPTFYTLKLSPVIAPGETALLRTNKSSQPVLLKY